MSIDDLSNRVYVYLLEALKKRRKIESLGWMGYFKTFPSPKLFFKPVLFWTIVNFRDTEIIKLLLKRDNFCRHKQSQPKTRVKFTIEHCCLNIAFQHSNIAVIKFLLNRGINVQENLNSLLLNHAVNHENKIIIQLLIEYAVKNDINIDFKAILNKAIKKGCSKLIECIIPYCTFTDLGDKQIPKHVILKRDKLFNNCVNVLLKWGFSFNPDFKEDENFIYSVVVNGYTSIFKTLVDLGININMKNKFTGLSLFHAACLSNQVEIAKILINNKANVDNTPFIIECFLKNPAYQTNDDKVNIDEIRYFMRQNFLYIAVDYANPDFIEFLLKNEFITNNTKDLFNIIWITALKGYKEVTELLLDHNDVDVNIVDSLGQTILHICIECKYDIIELLLRKGANLNAIDKLHETPLFDAVRYDRIKIVQLFLKHGADVDAKNSELMTPLHVACQRGYAESVQVLLDHGAKVNALDSYGRTPVHLLCQNWINYAAKLKRVGIMGILWQHNADINVADCRKETPLLVACGAGSIALVEFFLKNNSNVNHRDILGNTPLFRVIQTCPYYNYEKLVEILLEADAKVHIVNKQGKTLLHIAAENNRIEMIRKFIDMNIDVNSIDKDGQTPLHLAAEKRNIAMVRNLLKYGADVNILNNKNQTALQDVIQHRCGLQNYPFGIIDRIVSILKKHIIKLNCAKFYVNNQNLNLAYNDNILDTELNNQNNDLNLYYRFRAEISFLENHFKTEIERLKIKRIEETNIRYYDFLTQNNRTLTRFIRMMNITPRTTILDYDFPHYSNIIQRNIIKARKRTELLDIVREYSLPGIFYHLPHICIDKIFDYFNYPDLKILMQVMKTSGHFDAAN